MLSNFWALILLSGTVWAHSESDTAHTPAHKCSSGSHVHPAPGITSAKYSHSGSLENVQTNRRRVFSPEFENVIANTGEYQRPFAAQYDDDTVIDLQDAPPLQIQPLVVSGSSENRVDLVFFSDGYLPEEHSKFIEDSKRLAEDISGNQTFNTVKPLLNFWAAFSPSKESGIGVGGKQKDTPFGLYRDGTELRGVYYGKPLVARAACASLGTQCDYPILLGNDPLYGGLGGEFTVITSSLANGPLVLRHELGHSVINVGEEYDGGFAYFGPNAGYNASSVPWTHWLTEPPSPDGPPKVERSVMPLQDYAWSMLNVSTPWSSIFESSGSYARHLIRFSLSGLPSANDLKVELDGIDLGWTPKKDIGIDRWHYDVYRDGGLSPGRHEVKFTLINADLEGVAQLCSVESLEFGDETEFVDSPGYHGIFPTYSEKNETSYRPTNEDCLMRIVTSPNFCKACIEGLWLSLLQHVNLVDNVVENCVLSTASHDDDVGSWKKTLTAQLVPLGQFRESGSLSSYAHDYAAKESYTITWTKDGKLLPAFTNSTVLEIDNDDDEAMGTYTIDVTYTTDEVLEDKNGLLTSGGEYTVSKKCGN